MRFFYGFVGAILGAFLGVASAYLSVSAAEDGDDLGIFFLMTVCGPVGLIIGLVLGIMIAVRVLRFVEGNQVSSKARRKKFLLVAGSVLAVPFLSAAMVWKAEQYHFPPSDQQLLDNFNYHRPTFDTLAQMTLKDKHLLEVSDNGTQPADPRTVGVSPERVSRYRHLLTQAEAHYGLQTDGLHGADFLCWGHGGATSSDAFKGYAYLTVPPSRTFNSLDLFRDQSQSEGLPETEAYRHIEGCWYLYYEYLS